MFTRGLFTAKSNRISAFLTQSLLCDKASRMINRCIELVSFLDAMGVALIITLIPFFTKELGVSAFGFGVITSLYGLCQIIGGMILTRLLKYGLSRKTILMVSSIGSGISYALLLIRHNVASLVISRALVGLIKQTTTSCKALVMMSKDDHGPQRFSMLAAIRHMGSFIGSALLTFITKHYAEHYAVALSVCIFVVESFIIFFFIPDTKAEGIKVPDSPREEKKQDYRVVHHLNVGYLSTIRTKVRAPFSIKIDSLILYIFYLFGIDSINKGFGSIKIILLQEQFDVSPYQIGLVFLLSNLFMFITEFMITPFISKHVSSYKVVLLALLLLMAGKVFQLYIRNFTHYILFCVLFNTVGEEVFATTFVNILSMISPPHLVNHYLAYYDVVESICRLVGPLFLGEIVSQFGYLFCVRFLCISFLTLFALWFVFPVETDKTEKIE